YKFKGGKGVATTIGCAFALNFPVGLLIALVFLIVLLGTRYVSVSSITAAFLYPLLLDRITLLIHANHVAPLPIISVSILAVLIIFKHHKNISRLMNGTESKFKLKTRGEREEEQKKSLHNIDDEDEKQ
ncbi:MAG: glycerol-3-phosphate acyltransferase, partial [Clostridia bacterium]|nr:glycerol-3-phosphate acyltransferase [Clostridia bacterium]